jgi:O-antigen/teichoic acid export membrane protein
LLLPILAAAALSTQAAAYWYALWMMAYAAYTIPLSFGLHLFAELADEPATASTRAWTSLRSGIAFAAAATLALIFAGPVVLRLLGSGYASHGSAALRLAALAAIPLVVVKAYLFICRASRRLREATVVAGLTGLLAIGLAIPGAAWFGLLGIAGGWLAAQVLAAVWASFRLGSVLRKSAEPRLAPCAVAPDDASLISRAAGTPTAVSPPGVL